MAATAALTVRRNFPRPDARLIAQFQNQPSGWVVDANGRRGSLDHHIGPLTNAKRFCGVALTVHSRARDNLTPYAAIGFAQPGDVLIVSADAYEEASVAGDVLLGMAKNKGIVALVTDGVVRDIDGLNAVGIPVFARGLSPNSPYKDGPGEIGFPISIGNVVVESGDLVLGDQDGVVVVARANLEAVLAELANVKGKEAKMDDLVRAGATAPAWMEATLREKGVLFVD